MAVYEKKLPRTMRLMTQIFEILEPLMNSRLNRKFMTFIIRNSKLNRVTRLLGGGFMLTGG
ncbi:MAG: hypothetical protein HWN66_09120 [Candidatus Helarchaeota archaeon]|nr:hypothetical protein [Candidatus Helarchaeota archaeon]